MNPPNTRDKIKEYFITGAIPTEVEFEELIDAFVHRKHESGEPVGLGTETPKNILDVNGSAVIGHDYAGSEIAPPEGLLVEGDTGIGTPDPKAKLHVNGSAIIEGGGLTIGGIEVIDSQGAWHDTEGLRGAPGQNGQDGQPGRPGKDGDPGTSLWNDGNEEVTTDVNVGIKTKTPETTLHVNGFVTKQQVAFTLSEVIKLDGNLQLYFATPKTNEGGGWQEATHEFVAPANGNYMFHSNIIIKDVGQGVEIRLIKNNEVQSPLFVIWEQLIAQSAMSNSLAVSMQKGDRISLVMNKGLDINQFIQFNLTGYRL